MASITPGQRKQYLRFVEDVAERALENTGFDKDGLQRVIENGDDLQAAIVAKLMELSVTNQFADEEIKSSYGYPTSYKVKGITEQTNILRQLFPGIGFADEKLADQLLPPNAEGWFAVPRWEKVAKTYNEAVEKVLAMIASKRKFYNYRDGQLGAKYLRQHAKTAKMFQKLGDEQKNHGILVVPAQFGLRHRGHSVRRAREVFMANEFGLGVFSAGIMLLTHPERLVQWEQLYVDCVGDEYSPDAAGQFDNAPFFDFLGGDVRFDSDWCGDVSAYCGSASGFLPQPACR